MSTTIHPITHSYVRLYLGAHGHVFHPHQIKTATRYVHASCWTILAPAVFNNVGLLRQKLAIKAITSCSGIRCACVASYEVCLFENCAILSQNPACMAHVGECFQGCF